MLDFSAVLSSLYKFSNDGYVEEVKARAKENEMYRVEVARHCLHLLLVDSCTLASNRNKLFLKSGISGYHDPPFASHTPGGR